MISHALISIFFCFFIASSQACSLHGIWRGTPIGGAVISTPDPSGTTTNTPLSNKTEAAAVGATDTAEATIAQVIVIAIPASEKLSTTSFNRSVTDFLLQFSSPTSGNFSGATVLRKGQTLSYANTFSYNSNRDCIVNYWGTFSSQFVNQSFSQISISDLRCTSCPPEDVDARNKLTKDGWMPNILNGTDCQQITGTNLQWILWESDACEAFTTNENLLFGFNTTGCAIRNPRYGPYGVDSLLSTSINNSSAASLSVAFFVVALTPFLSVMF